MALLWAVMLNSAASGYVEVHLSNSTVDVPGDMKLDTGFSIAEGVHPHCDVNIDSNELIGSNGMRDHWCNLLIAKDPMNIQGKGAKHVDSDPMNIQGKGVSDNHKDIDFVVVVHPPL